METVIVKQVNKQWGFQLECGDFITQYNLAWRGGLCSIHNCNTRVTARGMCNAHYRRVWGVGGLTQRRVVSQEFTNLRQVVNALDRIQELYRQDYGSELPWKVKVVE